MVYSYHGVLLTNNKQTYKQINEITCLPHGCSKTRLRKSQEAKDISLSYNSIEVKVNKSKIKL